jgi:hypothetical protein
MRKKHQLETQQKIGEISLAAVTGDSVTKNISDYQDV